MASADRNGTCGLARYLPSNVSGGARSADEVIAQITIRAMNQACAPGPVPATNGSATKAAQEIAVTAPTNTPSRPTTAGDPVGGHPHRGVGDGEDRLIQHQDQDHRRRRDPDARPQVSADR